MNIFTINFWRIISPSEFSTVFLRTQTKSSLLGTS